MLVCFELALMLLSSEDYIQTLGVNFMEKTISIRNTEITFSVSPRSRLSRGHTEASIDLGFRRSKRVCVDVATGLQ